MNKLIKQSRDTFIRASGFIVGYMLVITLVYPWVLSIIE